MTNGEALLAHREGAIMFEVAKKTHRNRITKLERIS